MLRKQPLLTNCVVSSYLKITNWQRCQVSTYQKLNQETSSVGAKESECGSKGYGGKRRWMRAWEVHSYEKPPDLQLTHTARVPVIRKPTDVIVQVAASSLNPIDVMMTTGYGSRTINVMRYLDSPALCDKPSSILSVFNPIASQENIEFPLTLGRDFSGIVTETGNDVKNLGIGDEVMGVLGVQRNGSHADFVATSSDMVVPKPKNLTFTEAASLPYVALTAWSAIHYTGGFSTVSGKKFLVLGGSGGVGTFVIQYLRACGAFVVSTCSSDAIELLGEIGCHFAVDYKDKDHVSYIRQQAPFDCILDLSGSNSNPELLTFLHSGSGQYITLSSPFVTNVNKYGLVGGLITNLNEVVLQNFKSVQSNSVLTKWAFFVPCSEALRTLASLVERGKVKPVIQEVFKFDDLPKAYEKLASGHSRGKIVVDFANTL